MTKEEVRIAMNHFLKMYFDACNEVYEEINFGRITGRQFKYLKEIHKNKEMTLTELAERFNVSKPTMLEMVNKLIDNKILAKRKCVKDRRVSYIYLTEVGELLATTNKLESERAVQKIFERLTDPQIAQLTELFITFKKDEL